MEGLLEPVLAVARAVSGIASGIAGGIAGGIGGGQAVGMPLAPGRVRDLGENRLDVLAALAEAVVERDGVHHVPEVAEMREHADRTGGAATREPLRLAAHLGVERPPRVTQVVRPPKPRRGGAVGRPQPPPLEDRGHLLEVEVHHEEGVREGVRDGRVAPMPDRSLVDAAPHGSIPNLSVTLTALRTPSSWKPNPQ